MTLQATIDLLRAILADLPAAITTGRDLMRLLNQAHERLSLAAGSRDITLEDIERVVDAILENSRKIQATG